MEWIGATVLAIVASVLATMLVWVSLAHDQRAGLWWSAAGVVVGLDGIVTMAGKPAFLVPFASDAVGPTAAWLFYRGACYYAETKPRPIAAAAAAIATFAWFVLHYQGPPGSTFYASASAEAPLVAGAALLIFRVAETTMSRLFAASCALPILLIALNPILKGFGISPVLSSLMWLAVLCPVSLLASCVFLERSLTEKNRALSERGAQLRRYRDQLEDLVEQRTAQLEASQHRLRQSERLASIGTLTAGLAHQVNNPIGSIMAAAGFARLSRSESDELSTLRRAIADIEVEAARCGEIVRDMLRFASDRPTDKKVLPIDPIIERAKHAARNIEREHDASVSVDLDGSAPLVCASAIELEQALTNVVENAIQSREKGARVRIRRMTLDDQVRITVEDDGRGIADADLGHVLDPFFTSRLEAGGTGLGLSVAHGIAQEHGGNIAIESLPDHGTTVTITLPRDS